MDMETKSNNPTPTHLDAATAAEHPLAARVVAPSTSRFRVVQRHFANFVLSAGVAEHRTHPTARRSAGGATQLDLESLLIVCILSPVVGSEPA